MKFAVHCAPSVKVMTPGWIGALAAGAQARGLPAKASAHAMAAVVAARRVRSVTETSPCRYVAGTPTGTRAPPGRTTALRPYPVRGTVKRREQAESPEPTPPR